MAEHQSPISDLHSYLRRWGLRLRLAESLIWGAWGAVSGFGAGLVLALAARLWPLVLARWLAVFAALLALLGAAVGLAIVWVRPRSQFRLARIFDRRFGLAERLTTAVEIGTGRLHATVPMAQAQVADALEAAPRSHREHVGVRDRNTNFLHVPVAPSDGALSPGFPSTSPARQPIDTLKETPTGRTGVRPRSRVAERGA